MALPVSAGAAGEVGHRGLREKLRLLRELLALCQQEVLLTDEARLPQLAAHKERLFARLRAIERRLVLRPPAAEQQQRAAPLLRRLSEAILANTREVERQLQSQRRQLMEDLRTLERQLKLQAQLQQASRPQSKGALLQLRR